MARSFKLFDCCRGVTHNDCVNRFSEDVNGRVERSNQRLENLVVAIWAACQGADRLPIPVFDVQKSPLLVVVLD